MTRLDVGPRELSGLSLPVKGALGWHPPSACPPARFAEWAPPAGFWANPFLFVTEAR